MGLKEDLAKYVTDTFVSQWSTRNGQKIPTDTDIRLANDGVILDAVCLYADMAKSTQLVDNYHAFFSTEIYKTFLYCSSRIIVHHGGVVTAFDGDIVMGVFIGDSKNSSAIKCALKINDAVKNIINPSLRTRYPSQNYQMSHAVGIDSSELLVAKTGIRGANDLVWVGKAGNHAAKLCALREADYTSWITKKVYDNSNREVKISKDNRSMWEERFWTAQNQTVYRSNWWWGL